MKKHDIRKSKSHRTRLIIAITSIITISIIVFGVWWTYINQGLTSSNPSERGLEFDIQNESGNWLLLVSYTPPNLVLSETTITIFNNYGYVVGAMNKVSLSELTSANWDLYKVLYQKVGTETNVVIGASILVDANTYQTGYKCQIATPTTIMYSGNLYLR